jgi:hypothetical protein
MSMAGPAVGEGLSPTAAADEKNDVELVLGDVDPESRFSHGIHKGAS